MLIAKLAPEHMLSMAAWSSKVVDLMQSCSYKQRSVPCALLHKYVSQKKSRFVCCEKGQTPKPVYFFR